MAFQRLLFTLILSTVAITAAHDTNMTSSELGSTLDDKDMDRTNVTTKKAVCTQPHDTVLLWFDGSFANGPYGCVNPGPDAWSMLNSYRSGGKKGIHWKYTNNLKDPDCLEDWNYYASDGTTLYGSIKGRTTTLRDKKRWCATNIYRSGGLENFQWGKCYCGEV